MEIRLGFNHTANNLFLDRRLGIGMVSIFSYDWPHVYLQGGIFNVEVDTLMRILLDDNLGAPTLHSYLQGWRWPGGYASARVICKNGHVAGSISEHASLAPVLEKYLLDVVLPKGIATEACHCMLLLVKVLSLLQRCTSTEKPSPEQLRDAILAHLRGQQAVYGTALWLPKSHFATHLPQYLRKFDMLLSSLVLERKHKVVKSVLHERCTLKSYELHLMEDLVVRQMYALSHPLVSHSLAKPTKPSKKTMALLVGALGAHVRHLPIYQSAKCFVRNRAVKLRDAVCYDSACGGGLRVGRVQFICAVGDTMYLCIHVWRYVDRPRDSVARYVVQETPLLLDASFAHESLVFYEAGLGETSHVLVSPHLRKRVFC